MWGAPTFELGEQDLNGQVPHAPIKKEFFDGALFLDNDIMVHIVCTYETCPTPSLGRIPSLGLIMVWAH